MPEIPPPITSAPGITFASASSSGCNQRAFATAIRTTSWAFLRCGCDITTVNPRDTFSDVGHLHQIGIESRLGHAFAENGLVVSRGARGHHHPIQFMVDNTPLDFLLTGFRTSVLVHGGENDARQISRVFAYGITVDRTCYVSAAFTDKHPDALTLVAHSHSLSES